MEQMRKKPLFNPNGDIDVRLRRMIGGNTTNLKPTLKSVTSLLS